jgi:hypothetical protein
LADIAQSVSLSLNCCGGLVDEAWKRDIVVRKHTLKSAKPWPTYSGGSRMPLTGIGEMDCDGDCAREAVCEEC